MAVNLLPPSFAIRRLLLRSAWRWSAAWLLAAGGAVAWNYQAACQWLVDRDELQRYQEEIQTLVECEANTLAANRTCRKLEQRIEQLHSAVPTTRVVEVLGMMGQAAKTVNGRVQLKKLQVTSAQTGANDIPATGNNRSRSAPQSTPESSIEDNLIQVQGIAVDDDAIAGLIAGLQGFQVFNRIEIKSTTLVELSHVTAREFLLECRVPR